MDKSITCANCYEECRPARKDAVICGDCYAEIAHDMDEIANNRGANADDLFAIVARNNRPFDDSAKYRQDMKDAGRGGLLR